MTLRRARVADAEAIAGIAVRTWWHSHQDFVSPQALAERTVENLTPRWAGRIQEAGREVWVAEVEGRVAAYTAISESTDRDAKPETGALDALYVDPPAQGAGLGTQLLGHAEERLRERGSTRATLWVFAENGQARAFYDRRGWAFDPEGPGNEPQPWEEPAARYRRELRT